MHFSGRGFVHFELIEPETGKAVPVEDGAEGELVYTHLRHRGAPLLRFRSRDHVVVCTGPLRLRPHRAAGPLHRPHRRHADRARRQRVPLRDPRGRQPLRARPSPASSRSGPAAKGVKQAPPLKVVVELAENETASDALRQRIEHDIRATLVVTTARCIWSPTGTLPRSEYKSRLLDFSEATAEAADD